jgi:ankyrin repeat protein
MLCPNTQINIRDDDGHTPLSFATKSGLEAVVKLLIKEDGVQIHTRDRYGRTPLSSAARGGHEAVVKLLIGRDDIEADTEDTNSGHHYHGLLRVYMRRLSSC